MKNIIGLMLFILLLVSCDIESDKPLWVNMYDPDVDEAERAEVCGTMECGEVQFEGHMILCGVCEEEEYCDPDNKCHSNCEHFNCGVMIVETSTGNENVDCGSCEDKEQCGTNNICITEEDICGAKNCGKVSYTNVDTENIQVECGTCGEDEYCNLSQKCEMKSDNCKDKCGEFAINSYDGIIVIECEGCDGEFAYCNTKNVCDIACIDKECGTDRASLEGNVSKLFTCGACGDGMNYCGSNYTCKVACELQECGEEKVYKFEEDETYIPCGTCSSPEYCDATLNCLEGTLSGDYIYDSDVVIDTVSGLMWHRANGQELTKIGSSNYCSGSSVAGFKNWRVPNISELRSIVSGCDKVGTGIDTITGDDSETCGVIESCTDSTCSDDNCQGCTNSAGLGPQGLYLASEIWNYTGDENGRFWSSTKVPDKADSDWFIRFSNASVAYNWDGSEYSVICVRDMD